MKLNTMAWRNLLRNKRRTLITSFSVAFGLFLAVTFTGSADYAYTNMINTSVRMGLGHLTIEAPGYNDMPTLANRVKDAVANHEKVLKVPEVEAAFVRIMGQAMFATGSRTVGGVFIAVDPHQETDEYNIFRRSIVNGEMFEDSNGRGIVVGAKMAEKLDLDLGKKVIYTVTDKDGELTSEISRVSGIYRTGDDSVDGSIVLLPIERMRKTLRYEDQAASLVAIFIKDYRDVNAVKRQLEGVVAGESQQLQVLTWKETQAELAGLIAIDRFFNYLMQLLVGMVIAAGIMNTMLMSVFERTREFGMMMAIGLSPWQLVRMILIESFWIGMLGLVLGVVITAPWYAYMSHTGIDLSGYIGVDYSAGGVLVDPVVRFKLFKESAVAILAVVFVLTIIAGLYPAFRAGRVPPVESLKQL